VPSFGGLRSLLRERRSLPHLQRRWGSERSPTNKACPPYMEGFPLHYVEGDPLSPYKGRGELSLPSVERDALLVGERAALPSLDTREGRAAPTPPFNGLPLSGESLPSYGGEGSLSS
jgi:hypothetical protein